LGVKYEDLRKRVVAGGTDEEVLEWCFKQGRKLSDDEISDWNDHLIKRGWRDVATPRLRMRLKEAKLEHRAGEILTFFDFIEADEGRELPKFT
jgi:gluconokinase